MLHGQIIIIHQADISINPISCATFNSSTISEAFRPAFMPPLPLPCGLVEKITPGKPLFHWENHIYSFRDFPSNQPIGPLRSFGR